jgi:serine/threonine-protein kinase
VEHLGRYELLAELGRGAMGVVYKARDPKIDRWVALKVIGPVEGPDAAEVQQRRDRFQREARAAGRLSHPNIVTVHDVGEDQGRVFLVMEFIEGQTLDQILRTRRRLPLDEALTIGEQVALALDHAHRHAIVHRDVKPANILLSRDGVVKVTDFGIARFSGTELTRTRHIPGTPSYMSPEQVAGLPVDGRSDIFALGTVLYELLSGERAFPGETLHTVLYRIVHEDPTPLRRLNPAFSAGLEACLQKALAKDPADRHARAADVARDLRAAAGPALRPADAATAVTLKVPIPPPARLRGHRRSPWLPWLVAGGLAVAALVITLAVWLRPQDRSRAPGPAPPPSRAAGEEAARAKAPGDETAHLKAAEEDARRRAEADRLAAERKRIEEEKARLARQQAALDAERKKAADEAARQKPAEPEARPSSAATIQRRGRDNAEMVYIPAGTFTMGDTHGDGESDERPPHRITLQAFWLERTEVTNAQFAPFARRAREAGIGRGGEWQMEQGRDLHPVVHVPWRVAVAYCRWAGKRLPTEAEWEYAARGTDGRTYPWGTAWEDNRARFSGNHGGQATSPVGSYPRGASPFGILDMAGNVWEWVSSLYKPYPYVATDGREDPAMAGRHVVRGGSWFLNPWDLRSANRDFGEPGYRSAYIGFRCAQS